MKVFIKTYGCQANISDSEIIAGILKKQKHTITNSEAAADTILINSCSVKNKTQSKIIHYIKTHKDKKIIVTGCLINTINLEKQFPKIKIKKSFFKKSKLELPLVRKDKDIGIIQISQGCLNNCTFCATKLSKGNLKSYRITEIKQAFEKAVKDKCKKIYLTSQDNGCYGFDIGTNLPTLLDELVKVKVNYKIRVGMINPWHLEKTLPKLLKTFKSPKIQKFLHIPIQSGSEKTLKHMKREHSLKIYKKAVKKFRRQFPRKKFKDSTIATDIIVGYPTESERDFKKTLKLIKKTKPEVLNIAAFSSRPKTLANKLKQIDTKIIKNRTRMLDKLYQDYYRKL